jgi:hypothetical protein
LGCGSNTFNGMSPVSKICYICLNTAARYHIITMKSILFVGIIATMAFAVTALGFGLGMASAQMADNATMGNMTGGNMTGGNMTGGNTTEATGSISGTGVDDGTF